MTVFMPAKAISAETGMSIGRVYELAHRKKDPLPLRSLGDRSSSALVSELEDWYKRNAQLIADK